MGVYERYAEIYDRSGQISFSLRMIPYLRQVLERYPPSGHTMLDLACGTGTVTLAFAQQGWRAYGVDRSTSMLAEARRKAQETGLDVLLSQQDMRAFSLPEPVDLVTCLFDSLNYLLALEDLQQTFSRVAATLKPRGLFVCDMNTIYALAEIWDHHTYFSENDETSVVMESDYDDESHIASVNMVAFARKGELYDRIEELHCERGYPEHTVTAAMERAGLRVLSTYECFTFDPPVSRSSRILWVAAPAAEERET